MKVGDIVTIKSWDQIMSRRPGQTFFPYIASEMAQYCGLTTTISQIVQGFNANNAVYAKLTIDGGMWNWALGCLEFNDLENEIQKMKEEIGL